MLNENEVKGEIALIYNISHTAIGAGLSPSENQYNESSVNPKFEPTCI